MPNIVYVHKVKSLMTTFYIFTIMNHHIKTKVDLGEYLDQD